MRYSNHVDHGRLARRVFEWHRHTHEDNQECSHKVRHDAVTEQGFTNPWDVIRLDPRLLIGLGGTRTVVGVR
ncbi:hypothetical protein HMPREF1162_1425 [ [[Propionibacterium] namnetense SK182B-JCVI]|uniref:Uncharacterized protein n=1 Tax=[Propionibacterium] namnetense SK182B-JCVI TaxID=1051006 RepID=F9NWQ7_9ACTN|nr:hypothetical protein HMPREF1162_1425 [ [[Propionibacterium] namnetense SK182B-JCVI]